MNNSMTYGGIGPRLALMCLPYIVLSIIIMVKFPQFLNLEFLDNHPAKISGITWLAIGIAFWLYSAVYFLKNFKPGNLLTNGPFSLCRNPIYSSLIVFILPSIAIIMHSGLILSVSVVLYLGFKISIHGETNVLKRIFEERYESYERSVNEILPFPRYLLKSRKNSPDSRGCFKTAP